MILDGSGTVLSVDGWRLLTAGIHRDRNIEFCHVSDDAFVLFHDLSVGDKLGQVFLRDASLVVDVQEDDSDLVQRINVSKFINKENKRPSRDLRIKKDGNYVLHRLFQSLPFTCLSRS